MVFSDNGGETMEEKILRMIRNEGLQNGEERGMMDAPQMSCSDGHSVVVYTTFLLLDFWLCMRKEKQIQKTAHGFSPQSVMYLPNEICVL